MWDTNETELIVVVRSEVKWAVVAISRLPIQIVFLQCLLKIIWRVDNGVYTPKLESDFKILNIKCTTDKTIILNSCGVPNINIVIVKVKNINEMD